MSKTLPIGVFDSGMGGLTVLASLKRAMPNESFIYLGDTARLPYGTKSAHTVKQYALQMVRILISRGVKAVVIACNTATTAALEHLQEQIPELPIIGVVKPSADAAVKVTRGRHILIMATETTVLSGAYQASIQAQLPEISIDSKACSLLVALAEEGMINNDIAKRTLEHYLQGFKDLDTVVLGCTHFPVFKSLLAEILGPEVRLVDSGEATAAEVLWTLKYKQLLSTNLNSGKVTYLVTDLANRFQKVSPIFLGEALQSEMIEVVDV